jgi:sulfur carrier protein
VSLVVIYVNGEARTVAQETTVEQVVGESTELSGGVAAAVNGEVVPRREWAMPVRDGDRVEIVTAVQGG